MWFLIIKTKPQSVPLGQQVFDHPIQGDRLTTQHKTYGAYFLPIPISCIPCPIMNKILFYALKYRYPSYHCSTSNQCDTSNHRSTSNQCDTSNHHCTSNQCDTSNQCSTSKQHGTSNQCSTWNHRSTSNHPSTSNQYSPSNRCQPSNPHTPMMGFSPFEGSQKNIHWWDFPCSESVLPSWESPTQRNVFVHTTDGILHSLVSTQTCQQALSAILWELKPSAVRFLLLGAPHSATGIFPLKGPVWCFADGISLTWSTNTSLWALLIWTYGQMNPR